MKSKKIKDSDKTNKEKFARLKFEVAQEMGLSLPRKNKRKINNHGNRF